MSHDGNNVQVSFCPVPSQKVQNQITSASVKAKADNQQPGNKTETDERPKFGPWPDFNSPKFNFQKKLE